MFNSRDTSSSDPRNNSNQDNTDMEDSELRMSQKRNLQFLIVTLCLGSFLMGYCITISNMVFQIIEDNTNDKTLEDSIYSSLFTSMVPLGGSIGCLFVVSKVFKIGRRVILIFADLLAITGSIICIIQKDYIEISGMFILGIAVGINSIMIPMYLMEYAPCFSGKGRVIITHHFFMIFGIATSFLWGLFIKEEDFQSLKLKQIEADNQNSKIKDSQTYQIVVYIIPLSLAFLRAVILIFYYKKDTPFFYLLRNQKEKARQIIYQYYKEEQAERLLEIFEVKQARQMEGSTKLIDMLQLRYRRRVGISCLMNFFCYFSGVFFILLYSKQALDYLYDSNNRLPNQYRTLIIGLVLLFTQFFQIFFAKLMGRKKILLIGQILYIIGFLGLTAVVHFNFDSYLDVISIFMGVICIGFCFQSSVIPVIVNEILPERGVAAAHFISLFSITIGAFIYPFLISNQFIFYINSTCFNILGFLLLYHFVKETRGLTNYQIEKLYTQNFHGLIKEPEESDGDISRNLITQQS